MQRKSMVSFPKIKSVYALPNHRLLVLFQNDIVKVYDCTPLLEEEVFSPLRSEDLFSEVQVGAGGYGVTWNDDIDLSESELWLNGVEAEELSLAAVIRQDATQ